MALQRIAGRVGIEPELLAARLAGPPLRFAVQVVLARWLPIASFGTYAVVSTAGDLAGAGALVGQPQATLRLLPVQLQRDRGVAATLVLRAWTLVLALALVFGLALAVPAIAGLLGASESWVRLGLVLMPLVAASVVLHEAVLTAQGRLLAAVIIPDVVRPVLLLGIASAFWASGSTSVGGFLVTSALALLVITGFAATSGWSDQRRPVAATTVAEWRHTAKFGYLAALSLIVFYQSDVVIVGAVLGVEDAAVYAVATRLAALSTLPLLAVQTSVFARLSSQLAESDHVAAEASVRAAQRTSVLLAAPIVGLLLITGPWLLQVFGEEYTRGYVVLALLLVGGFVNALTGPLPDVVWLSGRNRGHSMLLGAHALANVVASIAAAHWFGLRAVALATAVITVSWNVLSALWAKRILATSAPVLAP